MWVKPWPCDLGMWDSADCHRTLEHDGRWLRTAQESGMMPILGFCQRRSGVPPHLPPSEGASFTIGPKVDLARYSGTGHGPWDHIDDLKQIVENGMIAAFIAMLPAIASMLVRRQTLTAALTCICIRSGLTIVYTHFWLID
jgi:hypothetical protein